MDSTWNQLANQINCKTFEIANQKITANLPLSKAEYRSKLDMIE